MIRRRAAKQPAMVILAVIVLGIYCYFFINDLRNPEPEALYVYLPAIAGGLAGILATFTLCLWKELPANMLFSVALLLTGIYPGLPGTSRLAVAITSLVLQAGAIALNMRLYVESQKRKTRNKRYATKLKQKRRSEAAKSASTRTLYRYVDWWILEGMSLFLIAIAAYNVLRIFLTGSYMPAGPLFYERTLLYYVIKIVIVVGLTYLATTLSDLDERLGMLLILGAYVVWHISALIPTAFSVQATYTLSLVLYCIAYCHIRKAGECRELNFIKTAFGSMSRKSLIANVLFFELIAACLGMTIFAITK
jgi:hypothetical protein